MRTPAFEIIGITRPKDAPFVIDNHFQSTAQNNAAFLAIVNEWHFAGICAWLITFFENLQTATKQVVADLPE